MLVRKGHIRKGVYPCIQLFHFHVYAVRFYRCLDAFKVDTEHIHAFFDIIGQFILVACIAYTQVLKLGLFSRV